MLTNWIEDAIRKEWERLEELAKAGCHECGQPATLMTVQQSLYPVFVDTITFSCSDHSVQGW